MKPYEKLHRHWRSDPGFNAKIVAAPETAVAALEQRYGITVPSDFRDYLLFSALRRDETTYWPIESRALTDWWEISRIRPISKECDHPINEPAIASQTDKYLVFADYAIWAMAWAISCTEDADRGRVMVINGTNDRFVADSFGDFVDKYIRDVNAIL